MTKINKLENNNNNYNRVADFNQRGKSYLINEEIKDTVTFEVKKDSKKKKKRTKDVLKNISLTILTGLAITVAAIKFRKIALKGKKEKLLKLINEKIEQDLEKCDIREVEKNLTKKYPQVDFSQKISSIMKQMSPKNDFYITGKDIDNDSAIKLYRLAKEVATNEAIPQEIEKNQQIQLFLLNKVRNTHYQSNKQNWIEKQELLDKKYKQNLKTFIEKHFSTEKTPKELLDKVEYECGYISYYQPENCLTIKFNEIAEEYLRAIIKNHRTKDGKEMTDEGKKLLNYAGILNKKAKELADVTGYEGDKYSSRYNIGYTQKTIENFKIGKFKTGYDEFWDNYFNNSRNYRESGNGYKSSGNNYKNSYHTYTNFDKQQASIDIFKKYGVDLGDLNTLTEEKLKKAYRQLAIKYHPDKNLGNKEVTAIIQEINMANDELKKKLGVK